MTNAHSFTVTARAPNGSTTAVRELSSAEEVAPYLEDSAHYPGGHVTSIFLPETEADVATLVRAADRVLPIGAQSSLTGGATPDGGVMLSFARMDHVLASTESTVRVQAGVVLAELDMELRSRGLYYPPIPTYDGATVGGTVATNAAGAATFKYGTTREWVEAITVVLADGDVLDLRRGEFHASSDGRFEVIGTSGAKHILWVPTYSMPRVPKRSAGYHAEPGMDLVDLFIGSEGTLGIIIEIELRLLPHRPAWFCGLIPCRDDTHALAVVAALRDASKQTWSTRDPDGIDIAAIEYLDRRCLELLSEDGTDSELGFEWPDGTAAALLFQAELSADISRDKALEDLGHMDDSTRDSGLLRLCRLLRDHEVFDVTVPALPGDFSRRSALFRLREAVPVGVNRRIRERKRDVDPSLSKSGGDVIVPFDKIGESLRRYREILEARGLDHAIWGHISDGNFHPNVLPTTREQMESAKQAQLEIGLAAIALGGCPLSEHGVGRNPIKQRLLAELYGDAGIEQMRALKRALDPAGKFAPGVLFQRD